MAANKGVDLDVLYEVYRNNGYKMRETAKELGLSPSTVSYHVARLKALDFGEPAPSALRSAEQLIAARMEEFARKEAHELATASLGIAINMAGPIGIAHFGDPHIDDPGTDIRLLRHHMDLVNNTDGMFAANVGDLQNNWVGRLAALYESQTITAKESWVLVEWMMNYLRDARSGQTKWLYIISGNHDSWSGHRDIAEWMAGIGSIPYKYHGIRVKLAFPNGREVRINTRHDFKGNSMWNTAHAPMKAAQVSFKDHIFTCGHRHVSGYGITVNPDTENAVISHCIRVSAYKVYDEYASKIGATKHDISPCAVTIIDPEASSERGLVTVIWDVDNAADYLTWLRGKRGHSSSKGGRGHLHVGPLDDGPEYELEEYAVSVTKSAKKKATSKSAPLIRTPHRGAVI